MGTLESDRVEVKAPSSCVALGELLNLSEPPYQFPQIYLAAYRHSLPANPTHTKDPIFCLSPHLPILQKAYLSSTHAPHPIICTYPTHPLSPQPRLS